MFYSIGIVVNKNFARIHVQFREDMCEGNMSSHASRKVKEVATMVLWFKESDSENLSLTFLFLFLFFQKMMQFSRIFEKALTECLFPARKWEVRKVFDLQSVCRT